MDLHTLDSLLSAGGQRALKRAAALAPCEQDFLPDYQLLSKEFPPELARGALELAILRREAGRKFPHPERMYFTRQALEQASSWEVSTYRAKRYRDYRLLADLGCSVGADTLNLAEIAPVIGIDRDPLRLAMAKQNLLAFGYRERTDFYLVQTDLGSRLPFSPALDLALFFDPARRGTSGRIFSVRGYSPPLDVVKSWLTDFPAIGVKVSPGVDLEEIVGYDAEVEFISLNGELKEADLWFGPLKTVPRRATVLPGGHTLVAPEWNEELAVSEPRRYLYEPDPAVMRAGLVQRLGASLNAAQLDPDIAYLTADERWDTPFARSWEVEAWLPFGVKRLRAYLREKGVGRVTVKKRGSPIQPEEMIRMLKLKGDAERVVVLTQLSGRPIVIVCTPNL